jgi:hypothetical protein
MSTALLLGALADALDAASATLRQRLALLEPDESEQTSLGAVAQARRIHPHLGRRQIEILEMLETAGSTGTNTGVISRGINYDQPNVYLTLSGLINLGFVEKDETTRPHTYRLAALLLE